MLFTSESQVSLTIAYALYTLIVSIECCTLAPRVAVLYLALLTE